MTLTSHSKGKAKKPPRKTMMNILWVLVVITVMFNVNINGIVVPTYEVSFAEV